MYQIVETKELFSSHRYFVCNSLIIDDFLSEGQSVADFKKKTGIKSKIGRFTLCVPFDIASDDVDLTLKKGPINDFKPTNHAIREMKN